MPSNYIPQTDSGHVSDSSNQPIKKLSMITKSGLSFIYIRNQLCVSVKIITSKLRKLCMKFNLCRQ